MSRSLPAHFQKNPDGNSKWGSPSHDRMTPTPSSFNKGRGIPPRLHRTTHRFLWTPVGRLRSLAQTKGGVGPPPARAGTPLPSGQFFPGKGPLPPPPSVRGGTTPLHSISATWYPRGASAGRGGVPPPYPEVGGGRPIVQWGGGTPHASGFWVAPSRLPVTGEAWHSPPFIKDSPGRTYSPVGSHLRRRLFWMNQRPERSSGSGANARQNSLYKSLFPQNDCFNQEKTVQFSRVLFIAKNGRISRSSGISGRPGGAIWPKNKGGS